MWWGGPLTYFATVCKTRSDKHVNCVESSTETDYAYHVKGPSQKNMVSVTLGGVAAKMLIDSGATSNTVDRMIREN